MKFAAVAMLSVLADGGSDPNSSRYLLIGTIFTGGITLILGLAGNRASSRRANAPTPDPATTPTPVAPEHDDDNEVDDLRTVRNAMQIKLDRKDVEIRELRDLCWQNGLNPNSIPSLTTRPRPTDDEGSGVL